ncbi:unnamed protein product, partial [Ectocarpus sp. 4 AP-2014]
ARLQTSICWRCWNLPHRTAQHTQILSRYLSLWCGRCGVCPHPFHLPRLLPARQLSLTRCVYCLRLLLCFVAVPSRPLARFKCVCLLCAALQRRWTSAVFCPLSVWCVVRCVGCACCLLSAVRSDD